MTDRSQTGDTQSKDDRQCTEAANHSDSGTYEKFNRPTQRQSGELSDHSEPRDWEMNEPSYESMTRYHVSSEAQYDESTETAHYDNSMYEKLQRPSQRQSGDYTELRQRHVRDSVISEASYQSIPKSTMTRWPTDNDDMSTLRSISSGDYLHPIWLYSLSVYSRTNCL